MKSLTTSLLKPRIVVLTSCAFAALMALGTSSAAYAGGVALGSTRLIYPQGEKQMDMTITNSDKQEGYLVQSWVSKADGTKSSDFVVTPPLFVLKPGKDNVLRVMYTGSPLPSDKESLFYLNSKAIPATEKLAKQENMLQIATQSVIKVFMRPKDLTEKSSDAPGMLRCEQHNGMLTVNNPSPYYITLVNFTAGGQKLANTMVSPKDSLSVKASGGEVSFQTINDFGAMTTRQSCQH